MNVKLVLFKSFGMNMYDLALWKHHSVTVFNKFRSCYRKCIKNSSVSTGWTACLGYSLKLILENFLFSLSYKDNYIDLQSCEKKHWNIRPVVPSINTILHNSKVLFQNHCASSCSVIVKWFYTIGVQFVLL